MMKLTEHDTAKAHLKSLIEDWKWYLGDNVSCAFMNDLDQIVERSRSRGFGILMDAMPALGKLYERGLEHGFFDFSKYPRELGRKKGQLPLLSGLIGLSFFPCGKIKGDPDSDLVQLTRSFLYLFKKVEKESSDAAKRSAVVDFLEIEHALPDIHPFWRGDDLQDFEFHDLIDHEPLDPSDPHLVRWMELVSREVIHYRGDFESDLFGILPKHGPGSVSDLPAGGDKYRFPNWPRDLSRVFPPNGWASHVHDCAVDSLPEWWGDNQVCSKLICVPKTLSKPRVIASEPTAKQYCQQALMVLLRKMVQQSALRQIVDFTSQEKSREILLRRDDVATIDLSAASDRVSANLVLACFRKDLRLLEALRASRTRFCTLPEPINATFELRKFAAMGSAVTFPVQSIIYGCAVIASILYEEQGKYRPDHHRNLSNLIRKTVSDHSDQVQVFGDDIIVPKHVRLSVEILLKALGLKVNRDKSFSNDFKESCGMDVYKRQEVTPLYLGILDPTVRRQDVASIVEISNNAYLKGYWNLAQSIAQQVPHNLKHFVPVSSMPLPSLRYTTFMRGTKYHTHHERWNSDLQTTEVKSFVPRFSQDRVCRNDWTDLLQYFIEAKRDSSSVLDSPTHHCVGLADRQRTS